MFRYRFITALVLSIGLFQCSEPEVIIPPLEIPTTGKVVLVEELTGVSCPNCPSAAARLESIALLYPENVIIIGIHGALLTKPLATSMFDFRNEFSHDLEEGYKPFIGKPSIVINRKKHPSFSLIANPVQDKWQSIIEEELAQEQTLNILIEQEVQGGFTKINLAFLPIVDLPGDHFMHVFLIEDKIIDPQKDVSRIIPDYIHDHVLRYVATPLGGEILETIFSESTVINKEVDLDQSAFGEEWNMDNLKIIVFITDDSGAVVQARKQSLFG